MRYGEPQGGSRSRLAAGSALQCSGELPLGVCYASLVSETILICGRKGKGEKRVL